MKNLYLFAFLLFVSQGLSAQLDTVYRITKSFDEATNGLKPQKMYCTVTNEAGDTLEYTSYTWNASMYSFVPNMQEIFSKTDSSEQYIKNGWNDYQQRFLGVHKTETLRLDSLDCVFTYEWDFELNTWKGIEGKGLCKQGRLEYIDADSNWVTGVFQNIGVFYLWEESTETWSACLKLPNAENMRYASKTLLSVRKDIYTHLTHDGNIAFEKTYVSADSLQIKKQRFKFAYIYDSFYQLCSEVNYKTYNNVGQLVLDSSLFSTYDPRMQEFNTVPVVLQMNYQTDTLFVPLFNELKQHNRKSVFEFDSLGNTLSMTNYRWSNGWRYNSREVYEYNAQGRAVLTRYATWNADSLIWEPYYILETQYDSIGNMLQSIKYDWDWIDARLKKLSKEESRYDSLGRVICRDYFYWIGTSWWHYRTSNCLFDEAGGRTISSYSKDYSGYYFSITYNKAYENQWQFHTESVLDEQAFTLKESEYEWSLEDSCWQGLSHLELVQADSAQLLMKFESCGDAGSWCNGEGTMKLFDSLSHHEIGAIEYHADHLGDKPVPLSKKLFGDGTAYVFDAASEEFVLVSKPAYLYYDDKRIQKKVLYEYDVNREEWNEQSSTEWYYSLAELETQYGIVREHKPLAISGDKPALAKLYPTMAGDVLFVELPEACALLRIFSPQGALVYSQKDVPAGVNPVSVCSLESGLYFLVLDESVSFRFMKE